MSEQMQKSGEIQRLVPDLGLAVISQRALQGKAPIGFMERGEPRADEDSGWLFMAMGDDPEDFTDPEKVTLCDVNTIANLEPRIIPHLEREEGSVLVRGEPNDPFLILEGSSEEPDVVYYEPASGPTLLTENWAMDVPGHCLRRRDRGDLVIWRPGITFWFRILQPPEDPDARLLQWEQELPPEALSAQMGKGPSWKAQRYKIAAGGPDGGPGRWNLRIFSTDYEFFIHGIFDDEAGEKDVCKALASFRKEEN